MDSVTYYHASKRGLKIILPPSVTGAVSTASYGAASVCRRDRVYITTSWELAHWFAAMSPHKSVGIYEVEPIGDIVHDPDCAAQNLSYECEQARIIKMHKPRGKLLKQVRQKEYQSHWKQIKGL